MVKKHLNRLAMPHTWRLNRKGITFVTKPLGKRLHSIPVNKALQEMLGRARTNREVKYVLHNKNVMVNGFRVKDTRHPVQLMDSLQIKESKEQYRMVLNNRNNLQLIPLDQKEAGIKPVKIIGKTVLKKGKLQVNCHDGSNLQLEKAPYSVGDVLVIKMPEKKIQSHIRLEKGAVIYIIGGKHSGTTGTVEDIQGNRIFFQAGKEKLETLRKYAFPIGKGKQVVKVK